MKIKESDVFIGDILYTDGEEKTSYWDEDIHNPTFEEYKKPRYKIREKSILVIRVCDGKFIKPKHLNGLLDLLIIKRSIKRKKADDARVIRCSRYTYEDEFIGNLRPRFAEDGFIELEELQRESRQQYVIINHGL